MEDLLDIKLPGDPGFEERAAGLLKLRAETLSRHGWRFEEKAGPRGIYYEGHGPRGMRIMAQQCPTKEAALTEAINHAFRLHL